MIRCLRNQAFSSAGVFMFRIFAYTSSPLLVIGTHLFVYGTLRLEYDLPAARAMRDLASYDGQGLARGVLCDLGNYPGAHFDPQATSWIYGQLFRLPLQPDQLLLDLDDYEGDAYRRYLIDVASWQGMLSAISYGLIRPSSAPVIASGDWYLAQTGRHKQKLS